MEPTAAINAAPAISDRRWNVTTTRIRCQVLEVDGREDWMPSGGELPRELLPWADPYIARLIRRLESRYNVDDEADLSDPFAADDVPWTSTAAVAWEGDEEWNRGEWSDGFDERDNDDAWDTDVFMPPRNEIPRYRWQPPVYGGFPLLDDLTEDCDADTL
jgi:hypothetical protein